MTKKDYRRILIVKMSSLGDVIHALPTLYALKQNWPDAKITWAVHEQFGTVLPGQPWLDEVIYIDKKKLKSLSYLWHLRKELHSRHFDMCLDLQCLAKSALVSWLSGAPEKYGYWELREGSGLVNKGLVGPNKMGHVIERYLDTVRALGGTVDRIEFPLRHDEEAKKSVQLKLTAFSGPYAVIVPGARWAVKEWPTQNFGALCKRLVDAGVTPVLAGAPSDVEKAAEVMAAANESATTAAGTAGNATDTTVSNAIGTTASSATGIKVINLVGQTSLPELIELIRGCAIYISADTGPLHMANALQKPLVALFGTTSPDRTGPYGGDYVHVIVSPTSKATPEHPLVDDPECMKQITVDRVWDVVKPLLPKTGAANSDANTTAPNADVNTTAPTEAAPTATQHEKGGE